MKIFLQLPKSEMLFPRTSVKVSVDVRKSKVLQNHSSLMNRQHEGFTRGELWRLGVALLTSLVIYSV